MPMKVRPEVEEGGELPIERCPSCGGVSTRLLVAQEACCTLVGWCCDSPACEKNTWSHYGRHPWLREFNAAVGVTEGQHGKFWLVFTDRWGDERRVPISPRIDTPPPSDDPRAAEPRLQRAPLPWIVERDDSDRVVVCRDHPIEVCRLPAYECADEVVSYLVEAANEYAALRALAGTSDDWHVRSPESFAVPVASQRVWALDLRAGDGGEVVQGRWEGQWETIRRGGFQSDCDVVAWRPMTPPPLPPSLVALLGRRAP
jgi:hypothetical protein